MNKDKDFSIINRFLLWCAGVDIKLLKTCSNTVILKYIALGGLVLTPVIFAFPSACYFLLDTLLPKADWAIYVATLIGLVWGLVILNFDRYLVISFNKSGCAIKDLFSFSVMSRIIMAGFISFVIAHPLVLSMFRGNIEESLANRKAEQREIIGQKYDDNFKELYKQINDLMTKSAERKSVDILTEDSSKASELKGKIEAKQKEINANHIEYSDEVAGSGESRTNKPGNGPVSASIKNRLTTLKKQLDSLNAELQKEKDAQEKNSQFKKDILIKDNQIFEKIRQTNNALIKEKFDSIEQLKKDKQQALKNFDSHVSFDFLTVSNELDVLSRENKNVRLWKWLLTGLLFIVDIFAVSLKVLSDKDNYDDKKQTASFIETNEQKIRRAAHQQSEADMVRLEYKKEWYRLKQEDFQQLCAFNIGRLAIMTDHVEKHYAQVDRFEKIFRKQNVQSNYASFIMDQYAKVSNDIFNNTLSQVHATEGE